jgi:hypothetical protein
LPRQENDGNVAAALVAAHQFGELEAVHLRHLNVDQRQRDVVTEDHFKRLRTGIGGEQLQFRMPEDGLERKDVLLEIVDDQHFRRSPHACRLPARRQVVHCPPSIRRFSSLLPG